MSRVPLALETYLERVLSGRTDDGRPRGETTKDIMLKIVLTLAVTAALASADDTCSAAASAAARVHAARTTAHDSFTLTYFNGRGLAEIPRTSRST